MNPYATIRAALELADRVDSCHATGGEQIAKDATIRDALSALAELERAANEPVAWMWNDELGIPHASAGSKKPVWLESSASAEYIKQANLRPLYAAPPAPVAEIREPTPEECERICTEYERLLMREGTCGGRDAFDAVRAVMWPKSEGSAAHHAPAA